MRKDVLIIAHFCGDFNNINDNNRFNYLTDFLAKDPMLSVELVTSNFYHTRKIKRNTIEKSYKLTLLEEPKYKDNVSLKRFLSHYVFGQNVKRYLKRRKKPDVIYCAIPSLNVAYNISKYAKQHDIKLIFDIQDLWPEAFQMVLPNFRAIKYLFYPFTYLQEYSYKSANGLVAVSKTYLNHALKINDSVSDGRCVFLGTDLEKFDNLVITEKNKHDEIIISYIGTLGHSYDIKLVVDAVKIASKSYSLKFLVMGDGPLKNEFENYAIQQQINFEFTGNLPYDQMVNLLVNSDMAVNPINSKSAASIINKVCDYSAAGLPILNTQQSQEYRALVENYNIGFNCSSDDANDLAEKISLLSKNHLLRKQMGKNSRKLAEEKFNRNKTYYEIKELIVN